MAAEGEGQEHLLGSNLGNMMDAGTITKVGNVKIFV